MLAKIRIFAIRLWSSAPLATLIFLIALAAGTFFGVRTVLFWHDRPPRAERHQPVEPWMTPGYIARSWQVPRRVILDAIDAPKRGHNGPTNLTRLAEIRGIPVEQIIQEVEAAISAFRENKPDRGGRSDPTTGPSHD